MAMRLIYMGTPSYVIPPCEALWHHPDYHLVAVVTPPAKKGGRGGKKSSAHLQAEDLSAWDPPLARWVKGLEASTVAGQAVRPQCFQPADASSPDFLHKLTSLQVDVVVTASYGQILSAEFLRIPRYGVINIHPSLLPRYRGASPVQAALLQGDTVTGVTVLQTVEAVDAGAIICQQSFPISVEDTALSLLEKLFAVATPLLLDAIPQLTRPGASFQPQDATHATYTTMLKKTDGFVDFSWPVDKLVRQARAHIPWPGSYGYLQGRRVVFDGLSQSTPHPEPDKMLAPGVFTYCADRDAVVVGCGGGGLLCIQALKLAGKQMQTAQVFWHGLSHMRAACAQKPHSPALTFDLREPGGNA